ncbi:DUF2938 domain-containing protein [Parvibaculaceae bacterium PLY_AMNH_Bact1]|nr:DUF2938 domain-containing protein [Parvibaculaceae bacterium PLY_AMNH_Bact1]
MTGFEDFLLAAGTIGVGATLVMDLWALFLSKAFNIPSLNYAMVGRWIGHIPRGRIVHTNISDALPVSSEHALGWAAHYAIGVLFAGLLIFIWGINWTVTPTPIPALAIGLGTLAAPFFVLQPGMGAGIAASKTPAPNIARLRSLSAHMSFGAGLYLSALVYSRL